MRDHTTVIEIILCNSCGGRPRQGTITGLQFYQGDWELSEGGEKEFVCQRCKDHPGIDPDVIFTDRGGNLWVDRIAITP